MNGLRIETRGGDFADPTPHKRKDHRSCIYTIPMTVLRCKRQRMSEMPWVRFFPSDWLGGTRSMSAAETGIYITLVATMYERGEPIPLDYARLARLCGASNSAFKTCLGALISEGKITLSEAGLWNDRVQKEVVYRSEKSQVGLQAANARWGKKNSKNNETIDANAMQKQSERNANQKPEPDSISSLRSDIAPSPPKATPRSHLLSVLDDEHAGAILDHRKKLRKPLTDRAARLLAKSLSAFSDPNAAADKMIEKGWLSIDAKWETTSPKQSSPTGNPFFDRIQRNIQDEQTRREPRLGNDRDDAGWLPLSIEHYPK